MSIFHAWLVGEDHTEFSMMIDAMHKKAAYEIIENCYPEARIERLESEAEYDAREQARWEALLARDQDDVEED